MDATNLTTQLGDTNLTDVVGPFTSVVNQLLDVSPPVALALVLSCIYTFIVSLTRVNRILADLGVATIAIALYPQLADPGKVGFAVHNPLAAEMVTGGLIGCAAIIFSPLLKRVLRMTGALNSVEQAAPAPLTVPVQPPPTQPPNPPPPT